MTLHRRHRPFKRLLGPAEDEFDDVEQKLLEHELAIAGELQANLLIPGYDLRSSRRSSNRLPAASRPREEIEQLVSEWSSE